MPPHPIAACINVQLLGTFVAIARALRIRPMAVAGHAQTLAAMLNQSGFNTANAVGVRPGALAIAAGRGWTTTGWLGTPLTAAGEAVFSVFLWRQHRTHRIGAV